MLIISIGPLKLEKELYFFYSKKIKHLKELELPISNIDQEGHQILKHIKSDNYVVALDEDGASQTTRDLHNLLNKHHWNIIFVIGGPNGLSNTVKQRANSILSFGAHTWPHRLVRVMLCEQLYRCQQIEYNHPYHRD